MLPINIWGQTTEEVLKELKEQDVYSKIVLAQSILETGWYKCDGCSLITIIYLVCGTQKERVLLLF